MSTFACLPFFIIRLQKDFCSSNLASLSPIEVVYKRRDFLEYDQHPQSHIVKRRLSSIFGTPCTSCLQSSPPLAFLHLHSPHQRHGSTWRCSATILELSVQVIIRPTLWSTLYRVRRLVSYWCTDSDPWHFSM